MAKPEPVTIQIKADASSIAKIARIIARHLTAMAEELEQPGTLVKFTEPLTAEQVDAFRAAFTRNLEP